MHRSPLFVWSALVTAFPLLLSLPMLAGNYHGRPHIILASLLVLRHPEVYIPILWIRHGLCHDRYRCSWISCLGSNMFLVGLDALIPCLLHRAYHDHSRPHRNQNL
ncbi:hypothetical protein H5410_056569 [Solanum commersonii]|uniref:Uncharacterized protein n=1 Tax=Solanum commersonii TaxID=4109 RepID=A0A9J5WKL6_SOLCO|nr:hypothetical protein H5410_056569 [Solanum commersonii]